MINNNELTQLDNLLMETANMNIDNEAIQFDKLLAEAIIDYRDSNAGADASGKIQTGSSIGGTVGSMIATSALKAATAASKSGVGKAIHGVVGSQVGGFLAMVLASGAMTKLLNMGITAIYRHFTDAGTQWRKAFKKYNKLKSSNGNPNTINELKMKLYEIKRAMSVMDIALKKKYATLSPEEKQTFSGKKKLIDMEAIQQRAEFN